MDGEIEALGDKDVLGESEAEGDKDALGDNEVEGLRDTLGEVEAEGESEALGEELALGDNESDGLVEALGDCDDVETYSAITQMAERSKRLVLLAVIIRPACMLSRVDLVQLAPSGSKVRENISRWTRVTHPIPAGVIPALMAVVAPEVFLSLRLAVELLLEPPR